MLAGPAMAGVEGRNPGADPLADFLAVFRLASLTGKAERIGSTGVCHQSIHRRHINNFGGRRLEGQPRK